MSDPELSAVGAVDSEVNPDPAETSTLFSVIDRDKVFGLNLTVPEDAKELFKPWNERESVDKWVDSGVDDQVRRLFELCVPDVPLSSVSAHHTCPLYPKCQSTEHITETWLVLYSILNSSLPAMLTMRWSISSG